MAPHGTEQRLIWAFSSWFRSRAFRVLSGINGAAIGWKSSVVPLGSVVTGTRNMQVGSHFRASGPVWMEAVAQYREFSYEPSIVIGDRFGASRSLHISAIASITIGNDCGAGSNVLITDHQHGSYSGSPQTGPSNGPFDRPLVSHGGVVIGNRCFFGDNAMVIGPVSIGDGSIVAAGSVVRHDVEPGTIVAGVPARPIRRWSEASGEWERVVSPL